MTVSATYSPPQYLGNGATTAFAFPYQFFALSDIQVQLYDTAAQTNVVTQPVLNGGGTYDYTVTGVQDAQTGEYLAGGTVTFNTAPPANYQITLIRNIAAVQPAVLTNNAPFPAKTVESVLDRLMLYAQQLKATFARAVQFPFGDPIGSVTLAPPATRASTLLGFNAAGEFVYSPAASLSQAQAILTQALAAATAATSLTYGGLTLAAAVAQVGSAQATIPVVTVQSITSNLTVPSNVTLNFVGGQLNVAPGVTVAINGPVIAPPQTLFTGTGTVTFAANFIQKNYLFDWWGPSTGSSDIGPLLNTITTTTPDYSECVWMNCGPGGGGTTFNIQTTWLIKNCTSRTWRTAGQRNPEASILALNNTGIAGANAVIDMECSGHCLLQGFGMNTGACDYGILIDGQNGVSGGTRISTQNKLQWNLIYNSGNRATFVGIAIALVSPANNEFMQLVENQVISTGGIGNYNGLGKGTGIYAGGSSNAHGHLIDHNSVQGCNIGVDAGWTAYRMIGGNFNGNNTDIRINHVSYSTTIEFSDTENGGTFLDIGTVSAGGEAPVMIRGVRMGTPGGNNTVPVFKFGQYIGTVVIEGVDCELVSNTPPTLYQINTTCAAGGNLTLRNNSYVNFHDVGGSVNTAAIFGFTTNGPGPVSTVINVADDGLSAGLQSDQVATTVAPDGAGLVTPTRPIQYITGGGNALQKLGLLGLVWGAGGKFATRQLIIASGADLVITANAAATGMLRSGTLKNGQLAVLTYDVSNGAGQWVGTYGP